MINKAFVLIVVALSFVVSCSTSDDKIIVTNSINLGKVNDGDIRMIDIECVNNTRKTLELKEVYLCCSWLRTNNDLTRKIEPKDTVHLNFEYLVEGQGYVERYIHLYFDKYKDPYLIKIYANVGGK